MNGSSPDGALRVTASLCAGYAFVRPSLRPREAATRPPPAVACPAVRFANRQRRLVVGVIACDDLCLARSLLPECGR